MRGGHERGRLVTGKRITAGQSPDQLASLGFDDRVERLLTSLAAAESRGRPSSKLREDLDSIAAALSGAEHDLVDLACRSFDEFRHEFKRRTAADYLELVRRLTRSGYPKTAGAIIERVFPILADTPLAALAGVFPTTRSVDNWLKHTGDKQTELVKVFASEQSGLYGAAVADWAAARLQPSKLLLLLRRAIRGEERPTHVLPPLALLALAVNQDKKASLAKLLRGDPAISQAEARQLFRAVLDTQVASIEWMIALADWSRASNEDFRTLMDCIAGLVLRLTGPPAERVTVFAGCLLTIMTAKERAGRGEVKGIAHDAAMRLMHSSLAAAERPANDGIWICGPVAGLGTGLSEGGYVSRPGAFRVALALRARDDGADPVATLDAVAANLGILPIGIIGELVKFEPKIHEDSRGGLFSGDSARVSKCGWQWRDEVLLRAAVAGVQGKT